MNFSLMMNCFKQFVCNPNFVFECLNYNSSSLISDDVNENRLAAVAVRSCRLQAKSATGEGTLGGCSR